MPYVASEPSEVAVIDANAVAMGVDMDQLMMRCSRTASMYSRNKGRVDRADQNNGYG